MPGTSETAKIRDNLSELMKRKDVMEQLIEAYRSQGLIGEQLVDELGFPRNDIDLVAVRTARNKHVCLQNDHVALMKEIEKSLQNFHQIKKTPPKFDNTESAPTTRPFARFELIKPLSPAYLSGIEAQDLLISFDDITASNFGGLPQLATKMAEKENSTISLYVKRNEEIKMIQFEPKKWDGKGLLGATLKTL